MWDRHWCPGATERVAEMAPAMNRVITAARSRGMLILHCPSDTMEFYKDHPGRKLAQSAPKVDVKAPAQGWCRLRPEKEPPLPIDDSDEGCDDCPDCPPHTAWRRQHPAIEIADGDAVTDSAEAYFLMRERGITNVVVMGVHANMCVLGRPFSIRALSAQGLNVAVMRDMTDSMYHHRRRPYVSHFRGTELVVEHIEKYWCPSVSSVDWVGGEPFRFREDRPRRVVMITGENEYDTATSLREFAAKELVPRGYRVDWVEASTREGDPEFAGHDAIAHADLLLVSVRRRTPPRAMMEALRAHLAAGRPWVGIRTASHAFDAAPVSAAYEAWPGFDDEVLGMDYQGHYGNKPPAGAHTRVEIVGANAAHPVLTGVFPREFLVTSHLYKNRKAGPGVMPLLQGNVVDRTETEPVAWVNTSGHRRVFYTSLGNREDFALPAFRRLLSNGIDWCLREFIPPADPAVAKREPRPTAAPAPARPPGPPPAAPGGGTDLPQETSSAPLDPATSFARFHVDEDLELELLLAEPLIAQPVFLNFDERGRMWVVEYRQYPSPAGLTMVSRDSVWRAVYDKVPPPPPHHFRGADRISIHEDTDGDGVPDKHSVFLDGLNIVTSVERGRGGVWVLNPPYLLFYPDANDDDVPDGDPVVHLAGFGLEDTHSVVNSLRWGPDGWLYAAQGSTVTAAVVRPGLDREPVARTMGQQIWRYHPETRRFETFSEGGGNAFGCEIDSSGRIFSGHNGGDTRGFHYDPGAYLQKGFDKHGPLSNPYAYGYFGSMPHHGVPRFTHNFIIYEGRGLPPRFRGKLLGVEPIQGRLVESEIRPDGTSFRTTDLSRPLTSDDRWFRPVDIKAGPDGAVYVCDWYDQQVNHYRNHEGKIDTSNGRIYRLRARGVPSSPRTTLGRATSAELVDALRGTDKWQRQTAQRLLADRGDRSVEGPLRELFRGGGSAALEALWALHAVVGLDEPTVLQGLAHAEAQVRLWTVRLAGEEGAAGPGVIRALLGLARVEANPECRKQLAATARRLAPVDAIALVGALVRRDEDAADARIPLMLWWTLEALCDRDRDRVVGLFEEPALWEHPLVEKHLVGRLCRRLAQTGSRSDLMAVARLFQASPSPRHSRVLLDGFEAAYRGRSLAGLPADLVAAMARHQVGSLSLDVRRGAPGALARALQDVQDESIPRASRIELLAALTEVKAGEAVAGLVKVLLASPGDDAIRRAALAALEPHDDPRIADAVVNLYPVMGPDAQVSAQRLLSSRVSYADRWVRAIAGRWSSWSGVLIPPDRVPRAVVRRIKQLKSPGLQAMAESVWPNTGTPTTAAMEARIKEMASVVRDGSGDPYHGRTLFQATCGGCHRLFGRGADVGPDLTTFKRDDLSGMLLSIVNPNAEIREGYENHVIETRDGRLISGFVVDQDPEVVVIRGLDSQNVTLNRKEMASMEVVGTSLMPEGLLDTFQSQDVRDLFAYLRSTQPLVGEPPVRR